MAEINLDDLEPNSYKYKEEQKIERAEETLAEQSIPKAKPVVKKGAVVQTKKSVGQKFKDIFIQEDVNTVKKYVFQEVIEPGFKNLILDCLSMFFFKEAYNGHRRGKRYYDDDDEYVPYSSYYGGKRKRKKKKKDYDDEEESEATDYANIVLKYREDAEEVVNEMRRRIKKYGRASVADLFDLIQITGKYTDNNWGWEDPNAIGIKRVSNGYLIDVEEAELLD